MLTIIDGWWGSGKSVLRGLLDGHPQVFVSPIQDSVPGAFARDKTRAQWLALKDTEALRSLLASKSEYYRIERFAARGTFHSDTSKSQRNYSEFNFDFYEFDKNFIRRLQAIGEWSAEAIAEALYREMHAVWDNYPSVVEDVKIHVTMDNNHSSTADSLISDYSKAKLLYVKRSPEGILATRAGRKPVAGDYRSQSWELLTVDKLIEEGEVERIVAVNQRVELLQREHPERIKIVDFEDIVLRTSDIMPSIAEFLGITWGDCLAQFSYCGAEVVSSSGEKYIGKINDRPQDILSPEQFAAVNFFKQNPSLLQVLCSQPKYFFPRFKRKFKGAIRNAGSALLK